MSGSFFDSSWYRVADLKLRLSAQAQIHRQRFRGQTWFIVQDHQSGRFHRLSPGANRIVSLLDGERTVGKAWALAAEELGDAQPSQTETIRLLSQLHRADLLLGELPPDIDELADRGAKQQRRKFWQRIKSPTAVRVPIWDPDRFLSTTERYVGWLFGPLGFVLLLAVVATGAALASLHWSELTSNVVDRVLAAENLLQMAVAYCVIKAIHELGHGYAAKRWGAEIHELGIMFLVFFPVAYVDASSSAAFRSRWQRAAVGGAGVLVELFVAALAMIVWTLVEPGGLRATAFNVMTIAGVSTLFVNGNPLLRFDGYYVLVDVLEIPNLAARANRYMSYLVQRYALAIRSAVSPATAPGEPGWFVFYSVSAYLYRLVVVFAIALFVASEVPLVGMALGAWVVVSSFVLPLYKGARFLARSPVLERRRGRVLGVTAGALLGVAALLMLVPFPHTTVVEGVIAAPEQASIRAETDGVVAEILATPNARVESGTPLLRLEDAEHDTRVELLVAQREEFRLRLTAATLIDRVQERMLAEQLAQVDAQLAHMRARARALTLRASHSGLFVLPDASDLPGRYVARGTRLGYVIGEEPASIQLLIDQDDIDPVRAPSNGIDVRFFEAPGLILPAVMERETPAAVEQTPSPALAMVAGGDVATDPRDPRSTRLIERMFQLELRLTEPAPIRTVGGRVLVRFEHAWEPIGWRAVRVVRQVFLRRLSV